MQDDTLDQTNNASSDQASGSGGQDPASQGIAFPQPQPYRAQTEDTFILAERYIRVDFELVAPPRMPFLSGQYVSMKVNSDGERRSYSIASRPDIDHGIELLVDVSPQGVGSQFLQGLQPGDEVEFLGPLGRFVLVDQPVDSLVFVATGSGIAPLRSMILDLLQVQQDQRPIVLYWGLRYVHDMFWQDEFQQLAENFKNFRFHPVISRPVPDWNLCRGRVTDCLVGHELPDNPAFYLCGNQAMIKDVTLLLQENEIPAEHIHHEKFY